VSAAKPKAQNAKAKAKIAPRKDTTRKPIAKRSGAAAAAVLPKRPRVRRAPAEAKQILLDACVVLLIEHGPDGVGLKDVARKAGVSHALVTHYFGSIDQLIEAALERYAESQRAAALLGISAQPDAGPREWMAQFFAWGSRPETARMVAWSFLKGIITKEDFFSRRIRGAKRVVDAVLARLASQPEAAAIEREDIEFLVLLVLSATHGYGLGREGYWPSLGKDKPGPEEDSFFFERLADVALLFAFRRRK